MTLLSATLLTAFVLVILGAFFIANHPRVRKRAICLLRSDRAAIIVLAVATVWFLFKVTQWGPADFGDYKHFAFVVFLALAILSWYFLKDFLIVRAGAILILMAAHALLNAAYMHYEQPGRLFLVSFVYAMIVLALYFGTVPYRMRDLLEWLFAVPLRARCFGAVCAVYGLILFGATFSY